MEPTLEMLIARAQATGLAFKAAEAVAKEAAQRAAFAKTDADNARVEYLNVMAEIDQRFVYP